MEIQTLLDRHETFKAKWLMLSEDDLFNWVVLWEDMLDKRTEARSTYQEEKQQLEIEKGIRRIVLKGLTDENGKKLNTEGSMDAIIIQEFAEKDQSLLATKLITERLENKTTVISEYINIAKMILKK